MENIVEFVRTPTRASGKITDEERDGIDAVSSEWLKIGLRTDQIDPDKIIPAIQGLYEVSGLNPEVKVVIVSSPIVGIIAGSISTGILHIQKRSYEIRENVCEETRMATREVVGSVANSLDLNATITRNIYLAIDEVTGCDVARKPTKIANQEDVKEIEIFLLRCAKHWEKMYHFGNLCPAEVAHVVAMRDVIGLTGLPKMKDFSWWELCSREGGPRIVHRDFCMVSDFALRYSGDLTNFTEYAVEYRDGWKYETGSLRRKKTCHNAQ